MNRFDINQGEIGNCWVLAALSNVAENEDLFGKVVPGGQGFGDRQYWGIFRFRSTWRDNIDTYPMSGRSVGSTYSAGGRR